MPRAIDSRLVSFERPVPKGAGFLLVCRYTLGVVALAILMSCNNSVSSVAVDPNERLMTLLESKRKEFDVPALGAVIVADGRIVANAAVGTRKYGENIPVTASDKFHIGSNTKAMTAALCAILVKEGKLAWNQKASELLNELKFPDELKGATLSHLLTHRSGLVANVAAPRRGEDESMQAWRMRYLQVALNTKPVGALGEKFEYSNVGYVMAGAMIEKATGQDWETVIREKLFEPLGIRSAGFGPAGSMASNDPPWPHSIRNGKPVPGPYIDNPGVLGPAGTVHMSGEDYGKWMLFVLKHGPKLLTEEEIEALLTPSMGGDYAYGWIRANRSWGGGYVFNHAGSNTLNFFVTWMAPAKDFGVAIFTNVGGEVGPRVTDSVAGEVVTKIDEWKR
jgi:CubicO group peptidase (beta-lactamase class C family)